VPEVTLDQPRCVHGSSLSWVSPLDGALHLYNIDLSAETLGADIQRLKQADVVFFTLGVCILSNAGVAAAAVSST
jgi:hypothetical protein